MKDKFKDEHFSQAPVRVDVVQHGDKDYSATVHVQSRCFVHAPDRNAILALVDGYLQDLSRAALLLRLTLIEEQGREFCNEAWDLREALGLPDPEERLAKEIADSAEA